MRRTAIIVLAACLTAVIDGHAQTTPRGAWNDLYTNRAGRDFPHNAFLAEAIKGRTPGRALDIGMGEGRNALFLATQGWEVTGFDISDVGVKLAREAAQKRGMKLDAIVEDVDRFDYGREQWDLVVGMYMHGMITRNARKVIESLKLGGLVVVEGFHRDVNRRGLLGDELGYRSNELLRAFDGLRVIHYEDTVGPADWRSGQPAPIVRFIGVREPAAGR